MEMGMPDVRPLIDAVNESLKAGKLSTVKNGQATTLRYGFEYGEDRLAYCILDHEADASKAAMQAAAVCDLLNARYATNPATISEQLEMINRQLRGLAIALVQADDAAAARSCINAASHVRSLAVSFREGWVGEHAPFPLADE
jgi:hypothetical protein